SASNAAAAAAAVNSCEGLDMLTSATLHRRAFDTDRGVAPHLARRVLANRTAPQSVRTTLRAPLQRFALRTLQRNLRELRDRHVEDGAVVVLDNASGEVLAWVGSSGALSQASQVDGVTALRQPGSALKPFLYAQAIAQRRITAASLLDDSATHIATASGLYIPQNYDHHFKGWVSARTALAASLNVPAVRTLEMVSPDAFHKQLVALGLPLRESGDFYGYSLALGSAEVSLLSLTNAYRTLANGGRASASCWVLQANTNGTCGTPRSGGERVHAAGAGTDALTPTQVIDPRAAFIVADILSDPIARAHTFGTDSLLATRFWSAVKTGTSKDMRDNWAIGFSRRYTVGVWVGNASGAPMWDVSGISGAAPVWAAVMQFLHRTEPSRAPVPPPGLVRAKVEFSAATGRGLPVEAARNEWFLQGTEQARIVLDTDADPDANRAPNRMAGDGASRAAAGVAARIVAPAHGTIIALDPDIPPLRQRVQFVAQGRDLHWMLDGKFLARGAQVPWFPWPGRHSVQLADARGKVLDEVRIEVRGAAALTHP
ncbi:MAG: penicillin-binding transpeptidase domain-containing protein, partial [Burkholderiaceae bacterium]